MDIEFIMFVFMEKMSPESRDAATEQYVVCIPRYERGSGTSPEKK